MADVLAQPGAGFFYGKTVLQDEVAEGSPYPAVRIASRDTPPVSHHKRLTSDSPIDRKEHTPKKKMGDPCGLEMSSYKNKHTFGQDKKSVRKPWNSNSAPTIHPNIWFLENINFLPGWDRGHEGEEANWPRQWRNCSSPMANAYFHNIVFIFYKGITVNNPS